MRLTAGGAASDLFGTAIFSRPMERSALEAMSRDGFVGIRLPFIGLPTLPDITSFDYRALFRRPFWRETWVERPVQAPTLLIWGERDAYLGLGLTRGLGRWVHDLRVERLRDASHWVQADAPGRVNRLLIDFFRAGRDGHGEREA